MNIGIVVEGERDSAAYAELIRKVRDDIEKIRPIICGGVVELKKKFVGWLKHFEWHETIVLDKALVIMDSDCSDASAWEAQLRQIYTQCSFEPHFPVHFHATKCEIETWLLADETAINRVSQLRGKNKQVGAVTVQLEFRRDAKELFQRVLSYADLPADAQVYKEIAAATDIGRIAARCPSFQQFVDKVRAC